VALVVSLAISVTYFLCRWAVHAPKLGEHDLGLTIRFAVFATAALCAAAIVAAVVTILIVRELAMRRRPAKATVVALVVALSPMIFFTVVR